MDNKLKHLEFIQNVINRMARYSFLLKGWCITLVVALFALMVKDQDSIYIIACFSIFFFWLLDGYFLWRERLFINLYDETRTRDNDQIDFSMNVEKFCGGRSTWLRSIFSTTLSIFYVSLLLIFSLIMYFLN